MSGRRFRLGIGLALCGALLALPASASAAPVNYRAVSGSPNDTFFSNGGLKLTGSCGTSPGGGELTVVATTSVNNALIHLNGQSGAGHASTFNNDLDSADLVTAFTDDLNADDSAVGQIVYAKPGGTNVTVDWMSEEADGLLFGDKDCVFTGHARVLSTGDADRVNFRTSTDPGAGVEQTFFSRGGLQLIEDDEGNCAAGDQNSRARTTVEDSMLGLFQQYTDDSDTTDAADSNVVPNFDSGEANEQFLNRDNNSSNHLVYARSGGKNVSVDWAAEEDGSGLFGATKNCAFVGSTRVAESGSPHRVNFRTDGDQALTTFFEYGGLRLRGSCASGELGVEAETKYDDAMMHVNYQQPSTGAGYTENDTFDISDGPEPVFGPSALFEEHAGGQIAYSRPGGVNVTVDWLAEEGGAPLGGSKSCAFVGTAEKNTP